MQAVEVAEESPDARRAGYKTAALPAGGTSLRVYAKSEETIKEIGDILNRPSLLSSGEMEAQQEIIKASLEALGLDESFARTITSGICAGGGSAEGHITGNEAMRRAALGSEQTLPFQSCQPPDKVRIAGAKFLVGLNSFIQVVKICAANAKVNSKQIAEDRKQVINELIKICNDPEYQIATPEGYIGGNNALQFDAGRKTCLPLLNGMASVWQGILKDPNTGKISHERLQALEKDHGHEFVEQMVTTAYRTFPRGGTDRRDLKTAYDAYCAQVGENSTDLDGLLFNKDVKDYLDTYRIGSVGREGLEKDFQYALGSPNLLTGIKTRGADGSVTIDIGHRTIVVNADQLDRVTLGSLNAL
jgi:hypothetical protein